MPPVTGQTTPSGRPLAQHMSQQSCSQLPASPYFAPPFVPQPPVWQTSLATHSTPQAGSSAAASYGFGRHGYGSLSNHAGAPRMNGWPLTAGFYTPGGSSVSGGSRGASTRVKLPKIELKSFSGKAIDWFPFWEHFSSLVDANPDLSLVDKLAYLKSVLKGDAALALDRLALTGDYYITAIEIFRERYGDSQHIISEHMEALFNLEAVTSSGHIRHIHGHPLALRVWALLFRFFCQ